METNFGVEKEDLAKAKRDLLMRFIKDQEKLQTRQVGLKPSNNDATFDILDGLVVTKDSSNNVSPNYTTQKLNEHGVDPITRSQTCIPNFRTNDSSLVDAKEEKIRSRIERVKSSKKQHHVERPASENSLRRLRSAPLFSGRQSRNIIRSGDLNVDLKARKVSSLSIVVPNEGGSDLTRQGRRPSLTCAQVTRPRVEISAVDVELFDRHTVSPITGPYAMFHLPPIASETAPTPPST